MEVVLSLAERMSAAMPAGTLMAGGGGDSRPLPRKLNSHRHAKLIDEPEPQHRAWCCTRCSSAEEGNVPRWRAFSFPSFIGWSAVDKDKTAGAGKET